MSNPIQIKDVLGVAIFKLKNFIFPDGEVGTAPVLHGPDGNPLFTSAQPGYITAPNGVRIPVDIGSATVTISGPVTVSNEVEIKNDAGSPVPVQERSAQGATALTVGNATAVTAGRLLFVNCSVAGDVSVTFVDGSTLVVPVSVGPQFFPFAVTKINTTGTTATATYANLS